MIFKRFLNWIIKLRTRYYGSPAKLSEAVNAAEKLHRKKGKRYRVFFIGGRYRAMNRIEVQRKKHAGKWKRRVNMTRLEPLEFYDTEKGYSPEGNALISKLR
jgi:hypothetical protein